MLYEVITWPRGKNWRAEPVACAKTWRGRPSPWSACNLPGVTEFAGKKVRQADADLPTCRGTVGTTIQKVTPVSITNHTGSRCITFTYVV